MKIVLLNTSEKTGGAAIAANRLMHALIEAGIEAKMLVCEKQTNDPNVVSIHTSWLSRKFYFFRFFWERLVIFLYNKRNRSSLFAVSIANTGSDISRHPLIQSADVIHIHWINQGFLSVRNIGQLTRLGKPVVWTLHDFWPSTGICHYPYHCDHYTQQCGRCPFLHSNKGNDLSRIVYAKKQEQWRPVISYVGCSRWMALQAKKSNGLDVSRVYSIPNPIDTTIFRKTNQAVVRKNLNLPEHKKLLLFGALNVHDIRKGMKLLIAALQLLTYPKGQIEVVLFGRVKQEMHHLFPFPVHSMGYVTDTLRIVDIYNAVDVFVTPSLNDNLPNTIMEAMACGTPCVGFNTGGIPEMIDHKVNGYVAKYHDISDLVSGIEWILNYDKPEEISERARQKTEQNYTNASIANQYIQLYNRQMAMT